jgi:hypothetical protein
MEVSRMVPGTRVMGAVNIYSERGGRPATTIAARPLLRISAEAIDEAHRR